MQIAHNYVGRICIAVLSFIWVQKACEKEADLKQYKHRTTVLRFSHHKSTCFLCWGHRRFPGKHLCTHLARGNSVHFQMQSSGPAGLWLHLSLFMFTVTFICPSLNAQLNCLCIVSTLQMEGPWMPWKWGHREVGKAAAKQLWFHGCPQTVDVNEPSWWKPRRGTHHRTEAGHLLQRDSLSAHYHVRLFF